LSFSSSGGKFESALLHVRDEKSAGSTGGTFTSGSFQTRTLNTVMTNEISGASLSSNQIILPSGTYYVQASAPAFQVIRHKLLFRNITDSTNTIIGSTEYTNSGDTVLTRAILTGRFTIASQKTFELQHRCQSTFDTYGFGDDSNYGVAEVYSDLQIWKVA
jgi:hypothetical protein